MSDGQIISANKPLELIPNGQLVERISESDRALIQRMQAELQAAERLRAFVVGHLSATYKLGEGDLIEDDGTVSRAPAALSSSTS